MPGVTLVSHSPCPYFEVLELNLERRSSTPLRTNAIGMPRVRLSGAECQTICGLFAFALTRSICIGCHISTTLRAMAHQSANTSCGE